MSMRNTFSWWRRSDQDASSQPVDAGVQERQPRQPGREGRPGRAEGGIWEGQRQGARPQQCASLPETGSRSNAGLPALTVDTEMVAAVCSARLGGIVCLHLGA